MRNEFVDKVIHEGELPGGGRFWEVECIKSPRSLEKVIVPLKKDSVFFFNTQGMHVSTMSRENFLENVWVQDEINYFFSPFTTQKIINYVKGIMN